MTTNSPQDLIDRCLMRTTTFATEAASLQSACSTLLHAGERVLAQETTSEHLVPYGTELHGLHALTESVRVRLVEWSRNEASRLGWLVATYRIVPIAREANGLEPITFITGNNFMPPLRAFDVSDLIWALEDAVCWEAYVEGIERGLDEAWVLMGSPEYDNALYVVDLKRWEHVGDDEQIGDDLSSEWSRIESE